MVRLPRLLGMRAQGACTPTGDHPPVEPFLFGRRLWPEEKGRSGQTNVQSSNYWSATTNANNTSNAWDVNFNNGDVNNDDKTNNNFVWCVRGGA